METEQFIIPLNNTRRFQFVNEDLFKLRGKPKKERVTCSINTKTGIISFSHSASQVLNLEKAFVKFYLDAVNKTIAFRINKDFLSLAETKNWRTVKKNSSATLSTSITPIIRALNDQKQLLPKYKKIEIKKWKDPGMIGDEYYYLDLMEYERNNKPTGDGKND